MVDIAQAGATRYKVSPPLRHTGHQQALWAALKDGAIDAVHSGYDAVSSRADDVDAC